MSGQCYQCGSGFGRFKKEYGCKNCGFSFCGKCLTKKAEIPKLKNEKHSVCNKCFDVLTGKVQPTNPRPVSPPEAYRKRMAALQNPSAKVTTQQPIAKPASRQRDKNLSKKDAEIAERLEKLQAERKPKGPLPSDDELNSRLARLKGIEPSTDHTSKKQMYHPPDRRTQQEQMNDLLEEIGDEIALDSRLPDPAVEVEYRLAQLKGSEGAEAGASSQEQSESSRKTMKGGEGNLNIVNNLDKGGSQKSLSYSKNINIDGDGQSRKKPYKDNDNVDLEEMNQLIAQTAKELEIDAQRAIAGLQKDKEIMEKLSEIKRRKKSSQGDSEEEGEEKKPDKAVVEKTLKFNIAADEAEDSEEEDEDQATKKLIARLLEESKLDEAASADGYSPAELIDKKKIKQSPKKSNVPTRQEVPEEQETDELPWCCICNEDATLRCHGCDLDLYCDKCFHEGHDASLNHKTSRYTRPKSLEGL
ncbi:abscission/NoCut checkpoint regulator-like [Liolophura sinensis]|uniref:abscission/NoCut checkpoint regulator-like n=1 Tax=Liolophura sinensis TaxID=3198878 RepID=UPI003158B19D